MNDPINRADAIRHLKKRLYETALNSNTEHPYYEEIADNRIDVWMNELPSAQPTLYGYNVEHLILIAEVLRKENMPPERVAEALTDIGRIVAIVRDEFEETLRKSVEQSFPVGSSI